MSAQEIQVIELLNPLDPHQNNTFTREFRDGQTMAELFPVIGLRHEYVYSLNGKIVETEEMALTYPSAGDSVVMCPILGGDDEGGGKSILRVVAILAISFFSAGWGASLFGVGTAGAAAFSAGVTMVGSMVVNAMLPPPKAKSTTSVDPDDTPTYGIDGPKNVSAEGIVVPLIYGQHRFGGNLLNAYVTNDGGAQFLHMLINAGEGPIAGISEVKLNDIPVEQFKDYIVETRLGTHDQDTIPFFKGQTIPKGINLETTPEWIYSNTNGEVDQVRLDFTAPAGFTGSYDQYPGSYPIFVALMAEYRIYGTQDEWVPLEMTADVPEYEERTVWLSVSENNDYLTPPKQYGPTGGERRQGDEFFGPEGTPYANVVVGRVDQYAKPWIQMVIQGNQRTALRKSFYSGTLPEARYELRVRRDRVANSPPQGMQWIDNVFWTELNEIIHEPINYAHTALVALRVRLSDQLNGIPAVTYLHHGKLVRCWDAAANTWVQKSSSNPAWIALDALTNKRYGCGYDLARFDLNSWKAWGVHCDQAGLQFNGFFDTQTNGWDAINSVFRAGHAARSNIGTRYSVVIERAESPRMMFSVANMIKGSFKQSWMSMSDRANEVEATYLDKGDGYKQKMMRVVDPVAQQVAEPKAVKLSFTGLTSPEEVYRDAMLVLNQNRLLRQTVEFAAPLEAIAVSPGDVVLVQHDMPKWSTGGRLANAVQSTSQLVLDRPVLMRPGLQYSALVHFSAINRHAGMVTAVVGDAVIISGYGGYDGVRRLQYEGRDAEIVQVVTLGAQRGVLLRQGAASELGLSAGKMVSLWETDAIETREVLNTVTTADPEGLEFETVTLKQPLPGVPLAFSNFMFGGLARTGKPFRILTIKGDHEHRRDIKAIEYNADAYNPAPAPPPPDYSDLNEYVLNSTILEEVDEEPFVSGTMVRSRVTVHFVGNDPFYADSRVYVTRVNTSGEESWVGDDISKVTVEANPGEVLIFRVQARDTFGRMAARSTSPTLEYEVVGRSDPTEPGTGLTAVVTDAGWLASWDAPLDPAVTGSELRIDGEAWEDATPLFNGLGNTCLFDFLTAGEHVLRLRHRVGTVEDGIYSAEDQTLVLLVLPPVAPAVRLVENGRQVTMNWNDCKTTQPLREYVVYEGMSVDELTEHSRTTAQTLTTAVPAKGLWRFWVVAIDKGNNPGPFGMGEVIVLRDINDPIDLSADIDELLERAEANYERYAELTLRGTMTAVKSIEQTRAVIKDVKDQVGETGTLIQSVRDELVDADKATANRIDTVASAFEGNVAVIRDELYTNVTATQSAAARIETVAAEFNGNIATVRDEIDVVVDANQATAHRVEVVAAEFGGNLSALTQEVTNVATSSAAMGERLTTLTATVSKNQAGYVDQIKVLVDADTALSQQFTALGATVGKNHSQVTTSIQTLSTAQSTQAERIDTVQSQATRARTFYGNTAPANPQEGDVWYNATKQPFLRRSGVWEPVTDQRLLNNIAAISTMEKTVADGDKANADRITAMTTRVGNVESNYVAKTQLESLVDAAIGNDIRAIESKVGTVSGQVATLSNTTATLSGNVAAQHMIRAEVVGTTGKRYIAGITTNVSANNQGQLVQSEVIVNANTFEVITAANANTRIRVFKVQDGTVYMDNARIRKADIQALHLAGNAVAVNQGNSGTNAVELTINVPAGETWTVMSWFNWGAETFYFAGQAGHRQTRILVNGAVSWAQNFYPPSDESAGRVPGFGNVAYPAVSFNSVDTVNGGTYRVRAESSLPTNQPSAGSIQTPITITTLAFRRVN